MRKGPGEQGPAGPGSWPWIIALVLIAPSLAASGEPAAGDQTTLDEIVVVATKRENSIRDVAADVVILSDADLSATMRGSLADAFRFVPGVSHEGAGSRFGSEGLTIRGIGGNRIAIELDGVPVSDQFDVGRFSNATRSIADSGLIGQIEVLRGPSSALYGSSALGGVVAVRTHDPRDFAAPGSMGGRAGATWRGADSSAHVHGGVGFNAESVAVLLAATRRDGNELDSAAAGGNADRQDYTRESALFKLVGRNRLDHDWRISAIRQTYDVRTSVQSVLGNGRFRSTTRLDGDDRHETSILSAEYRFGAQARGFDEGLVRVYHADNNIRQDTLDERAAASDPVSIEREFDYDQRLRGIELNLWRDFEAGAWTHTLGVGAEWGDRLTTELRDGRSTSLTDGSVTSDILGESFPLRDFPVTETRELGAYVSDQATRGPLTVLAALRFDQNRLDPQTDLVFTQDNPATEPVSLSDSDVSPKLGAVWRLREDVDVYVQYTHGFRAPPFEDANIGLDIPLFNIRALPNPDLRSEVSDGWEAGFRWLSADTQLRIGLFRTDYDDFIETKARVGVDPQSGRVLFQSINIGQAHISGAEARVAHALDSVLRGLTAHVSAYWARGKNDDSGAPLNSVGPAQAVLGATWRSASDNTRVHALFTATKSWSRRDETGGELYKPAGYGVFDVFATHRIGPRLSVRAGVENLTDRAYWQWAQVRGLAPDDPMLASLASPGRSYSISLRWDW